MTLRKVVPAPGVNREMSWYSAEGRWYDSNNVRFRQGYPEKIGGWECVSTNTYLGVCRALFNWSTLAGQNLVALGTNLKYYIERSGEYFDITPIRSTVVLTDPFATTSGSAVVVVTDVAHGAVNGDFVTFSGASAVGGLTLNNEYQITYIDADSYSITASSAASGTATGGGTVTAAYQLNTGATIELGGVGWGIGGWGMGPWGVGVASTYDIRLWSQSNFGEDLIFAPRRGPLCIWDATTGLAVRGTLLADAVGASDVPEIVLGVFVADVSRFVFAMGCNPLGSSTLDPMLIRWSDQENAIDWTPTEINQAGDLRLSNGSEIVSFFQSRQEILVWTDAALYSLQYVGPASGVWGAQLVGEHISIAGANAGGVAQSKAYWMGFDKFYYYDGTVGPLRCDVRRHIFSDFNQSQYAQVTCGVNESFDEVWWFYCSAASTQLDRYVIYNYVDNAWSYGEFGRTAWLDSHLRDYPLAATYANNLVYHELGTDDNTDGTAVALPAHITTGQFDIDDGDRFSFMWRVLPDFDFTGSTSATPNLTLSLLPFANAGSGVTDPASVGGDSSGIVTRAVSVPVEEFTGQLNIRARGRQLVVKVESDDLGVAWQYGSVRLDVKPDGRR